MPSYALDVFVVATALLALLTPPRTAFAVFVGSVLVVPALLPVPKLPISFITYPRLLVGALALGLILRAARGRLPGRLLALTPVHGALVVFLLLATILGVALATPNSSDVASSHILTNYADQLLFFVVGLAAVRAIGDHRYVLGVFAAAGLAAAAIGVGEHAVGSSWARAVFFHHRPSIPGASDPLQVRNGHLRARGAASFAVEYAWVLGALLPALLGALLGARRRVFRLLTPVCVGFVLLAGYWSYTRSVVVPLAVGLVLFAVVVRDRRLLGMVGAAIVGTLLVVASSPSFASIYSKAADIGSLTSRSQRLLLVLHAVRSHSVHGLGLDAIQTTGLVSTDNSYLLLYAEIGVLGLAAFLVLLLVALFAVGRGLTVPDPAERTLAAAAFCGILLLAVGGLAFDQVAALQSTHVFWLLAAAGVAVAERRAAPAWLAVHLSIERIVLATVAAGLIGIVAFEVAPVHDAVEFQVDTIPTATLATSTGDPSFMGTTLLNSTCSVVSALHQDPARPLGTHVRVQCEALFAQPYRGVMRVEAPNRPRLVSAVHAIVTGVRRNPALRGLRLSPYSGIWRGRVTAARTAPVWVTELGFGLALFLPIGVRRRPGHRLPPSPRTLAPA